MPPRIVIDMNKLRDVDLMPRRTKFFSLSLSDSLINIPETKKECVPPLYFSDLLDLHFKPEQDEYLTNCFLIDGTPIIYMYKKNSVFTQLAYYIPSTKTLWKIGSLLSATAAGHGYASVASDSTTVNKLAGSVYGIFSGASGVASALGTPFASALSYVMTNIGSLASGAGGYVASAAVKTSEIIHGSSIIPCVNLPMILLFTSVGGLNAPGLINKFKRNYGKLTENSPHENYSLQPRQWYMCEEYSKNTSQYFFLLMIPLPSPFVADVTNPDCFIVCRLKSEPLTWKDYITQGKFRTQDADGVIVLGDYGEVRRQIDNWDTLVGDFSPSTSLWGNLKAYSLQDFNTTQQKYENDVTIHVNNRNISVAVIELTTQQCTDLDDDRGESCRIYPFEELNKVYRDNISYKWTQFTVFNAGRFVHKMYLTYQELFHIFLFEINERDDASQTAQYKELKKRTASEEETIKHTSTTENRYFILYVISERMDKHLKDGRNTAVRGYKVDEMQCYTFYTGLDFNDLYQELRTTRIGGECFCFNRVFSKRNNIKLMRCRDFNKARRKLHHKSVKEVKEKLQTIKRKKEEDDERERVKARDISKLRQYEDKLFRDLDRDRKRRERRDDLAKNIQKLEGRVKSTRNLRHPSSNLPIPARDYTRKRSRHRKFRQQLQSPYHRYVR